MDHTAKGGLVVYRPKRGTYEIDRVFPTLGRVRIRTGTHDKRLADRYELMLESLPLEVVRLISDGKLAIRVAYDAWSTGQANTLPSAQGMRPLLEAMKAWIENPPEPVSEGEYWRRHTVAELLGKDRPNVQDLAGLLRKTKIAHRDRGATFNRMRAVCMAFLRDEVGRRHPVYLDVAGIAPLPEPRKFKRHPCTVLEAQQIRAALGERWGAVWWALCCHGLGPKEYWVDGWTVEGNALEIHGRKRTARERIVPLVVIPPEPSGKPGGFSEALDRSELGVTPYDARRSYSRWLDELGVPLYQHNALMGHGPKDMRTLYSSGDISAWIADIGERLREKVGEKMQLRVAK